MATLREIRTRISSIRNTQQITKAMKMVAAAKLRKAQENIVSLRPYAYEIGSVISKLTALTKDQTQIPLMQHRPVERVLTVSVTADKGLCGGFNSNIIRQVAKRMDDYSEKEVDLYTVGRKGHEFFKRRSVSIQADKINFFNYLTIEDAIEISKNLISYYINGKYDPLHYDFLLVKYLYQLE